MKVMQLQLFFVVVTTHPFFCCYTSFKPIVYILSLLILHLNLKRFKVNTGHNLWVPVYEIIPSFVAASESKSIMESMEPNRFLLIPVIGENKLRKLWKGSWKSMWMLLARRVTGARNLGKKNMGGLMWSATWNEHRGVSLIENVK